MRLEPETLLVLLAASALASFGAGVEQDPRTQAGATTTPSPFPTPTPRYKLLPYGFEPSNMRSTAPLLRFEDAAEVRSLEMNAAIARFFDKGDEKGNMIRGATPGGAPTRSDLTPYRPHVTPPLDLLGAAIAVVKEIRGQAREHEPRKKGEDMLRSLLLAPSPSPSPSPSPTPSPSPKP